MHDSLTLPASTTTSSPMTASMPSARSSAPTRRLQVLDTKRGGRGLRGERELRQVTAWRRGLNWPTSAFYLLFFLLFASVLISLSLLLTDRPQHAAHLATAAPTADRTYDVPSEKVHVVSRQASANFLPLSQFPQRPPPSSVHHPPNRTSIILGAHVRNVSVNTHAR